MGYPQHLVHLRLVCVCVCACAVVHGYVRVLSVVHGYVKVLSEAIGWEGQLTLEGNLHVGVQKQG